MLAAADCLRAAAGEVGESKCSALNLHCILSIFFSALHLEQVQNTQSESGAPA